MLQLTWDETHDDVIKWKHFPRYWPFVQGIHWSPVNSPHKGQWRRALIFYLTCAWKKDGWVINRDAGDLGRHRVHYDITVMWWHFAEENFTETTLDIAHYGVFENTYLKILLHLQGINEFLQSESPSVVLENRVWTYQFAAKPDGWIFCVYISLAYAMRVSIRVKQNCQIKKYLT